MCRAQSSARRLCGKEEKKNWKLYESIYLYIYTLTHVPFFFPGRANMSNCELLIPFVRLRSFLSRPVSILPTLGLFRSSLLPSHSLRLYLLFISTHLSPLSMYFSRRFTAFSFGNGNWVFLYFSLFLPFWAVVFGGFDALFEICKCNAVANMVFPPVMSVPLHRQKTVDESIGRNVAKLKLV